MGKHLNAIVLILVGLFSLLLFTSCCEVSTKAGTGVPGNSNGVATAAQFNQPAGLTIDPWKNIYIADYGNNRIRQIVFGMGNVQYFAGTGVAGCANGHMLDVAQFRHPVDLARDNSGNFFVADRDNHLIRKIDIGSGMVSTVAGICNVTFPRPDGCGDRISVPDSVMADSALFNYPSGIVVDNEGFIYVSDFGSCSVRKIDPITGWVTIVGNSSSASIGCCSCSGLFSYPTGIDMDAKGNIFVAEYWGNMRIKKIDPAGNVTVWAGVNPGYSDGAGLTEARFMHPFHLVVDKATGNIYVADMGNNRIRKIANDENHTVCTVAGNGVSGFNDDSWWGSCCNHNEGGDASFNGPKGIEFVEELLLYIGDTGNHRIREIDP